MTDGFRDKTPPPSAAPGEAPVPLRGVEVTDDDPEASWSLWNQAVADFNAKPAGSYTDTQPTALEPYPVTRPLGLEDKTPEQRKNDALAVIEQQHPRIAGAIRATWGFDECARYINKLVLNGSDDMGHIRIGFNPQVVDALMGLADLHETLFGHKNLDDEPGFADHSVRVGLDGAR